MFDKSQPYIFFGAKFDKSYVISIIIDHVKLIN